MIYLNVRHTVADYSKWRVAFDADETARRAAGATGVQQVYRDLDNPGAITVIIEWDDAEKALKFGQDPRFAEVTKKAGVIGAPEVHLLNRA